MLILFINLLTSLYARNNTSSILGYSLAQMIWYFGAVKFFFYLVVSYTDRSLSESILSGGLATKMIKPVSIILMEFSEALVARVGAFFLEFVPNFIIYSILVPPSFMTVESFIKYLILTALAFVLFFLMSFMLGLIAFKWENAEAFYEIKALVISVLSGASIPIEFFPTIFQRIIKFLPFQYMFYTPIRVFLNMPETQGIPYFINTFMMLALWIGILYVAALALWRKNSPSFSAVG
jgi:viologen exporter family transport system permease protein